ncbi:hypothetical protein Dimus_003403 [Dionaea muscipula]
MVNRVFYFFSRFQVASISPAFSGGFGVFLAVRDCSFHWSRVSPSLLVLFIIDTTMTGEMTLGGLVLPVLMMIQLQETHKEKTKQGSDHGSAPRYSSLSKSILCSSPFSNAGRMSEHVKAIWDSSKIIVVCCLPQENLLLKNVPPSSMDMEVPVVPALCDGVAKEKQRKPVRCWFAKGRTCHFADRACKWKNFSSDDPVETII